MTWQYIVATLILSVVAYLIGSISWAIIVSKLLKKEDIRTKGSGNAGATNVMRNYGKKVALAVFILDVSKPVIGVLIANMIMKYSHTELFSDMSMQFIGLMAVIGHIYPIFFKFKGGKGAATFVGYIIAMQWILFFVGFITFWTITLKWRKVSLGSVIAPGIVAAVHALINPWTDLNSTEWSNPLMNNSPWWVSTIFLVVAWAIIVFKHKDNIKRLLNGTERTIDEKKKA